jgi:hypothetical protein
MARHKPKASRQQTRQFKEAQGMVYMKCSRCNQWYPHKLDYWGIYRGKPYLRTVCRLCNAEHERTKRAARTNLEKQVEGHRRMELRRRRRKYEGRDQRHLVHKPQWWRLFAARRSPKARQSGHLARAALKRGDLEPPADGLCEVCGTAAWRHMHHADYDLPLDVVFLCLGCHRRIHAAIAAARAGIFQGKRPDLAEQLRPLGFEKEMLPCLNG